MFYAIGHHGGKKIKLGGHDDTNYKVGWSY